MSIRPQLIVAAVCIALGAAAAWTAQEWRHDARHARLIAEHSQLLEQQAQAVVESVQAALNEEQRRMDELENQRDIAIEQNEALAADVAAGRTVSERLRQQLDALRTRYTSCHSAAAERGPGQSDIDAIGVLADMYQGLEQRGRAVAEYADRLKIAGLACERSYASLQ